MSLRALNRFFLDPLLLLFGLGLVCGVGFRVVRFIHIHQLPTFRFSI